MPGKSNSAADAASRHPCRPNDFCELSNAALMSVPDEEESELCLLTKADVSDSIAVGWDEISMAYSDDLAMRNLSTVVTKGFPDSLKEVAPDLRDYWAYRSSLSVLDDVVFLDDRLVVPQSIRRKILATLHSAHQGVTGMEARARTIVFWPGISKDIVSFRNDCQLCNRNAPSQSHVPTAASPPPGLPFESIFADYFELCGHHYLVVGDRFSGWVEIFSAPHGTSLAGSLGLHTALRRFFATFGVPSELSSDGGPEFTSDSTTKFLAKWGVHHRVSSAFYPQSNGRAELAVKKAKRLLGGNIGPNGSLNNDLLLRALLQVRNTPNQDSGSSPAEIVFGRQLRDAFSFVNRTPVFDNPAIHPRWRQAWLAKERILANHQSQDPPSRPLEKLVAGDTVYVQNQHGPHPLKWDKVGTIIEPLTFNKFLVKTHGSGRVTMRNRRFLRKCRNQRGILCSPQHCRYELPREMMNTTPPNTDVRNVELATPMQLHSPTCNDDDASEPLHGGHISPPPTPPALQEPAVPAPSPQAEMVHQSTHKPPTDDSQELMARPRREAKKRLIYEPESGTWVHF